MATPVFASPVFDLNVFGGQAALDDPLVFDDAIFDTVDSMASGIQTKYWTGSAWVIGRLLRWDGYNWTDVQASYWNGTEQINLQRGITMIDFPASPTVGQEVTFGASVFKWDGAKWAYKAVALLVPTTGDINALVNAGIQNVGHAYKAGTVTTLAGSSTLTLAQSGGVFEVTGAAPTYITTLPAISTTTAGVTTYTFTNGRSIGGMASTPVVIAANASEQIVQHGSSGTNISIMVGGSVTIISNGTSWVAFGATSSVSLLPTVSGSRGYRRTGFQSCMQWGSYSWSSSSTSDNFLTNFDNVVSAIAMIAQDTGGSQTLCRTNINTSSIDCNIYDNTNTLSAGVFQVDYIIHGNKY